jgi:hypothetical protein
VGAYEDLILSTAEAIMVPGRPMHIADLLGAATARLGTRFGGLSLTGLATLTIVLGADPRFAEVEPGVWVRRGDGPEAGVRSTPRRPPLAGGAAATAEPPEPVCDVDAVGAAEARLSPSSCRRALAG